VRNDGPPGTTWTAFGFAPSAERRVIASRLASKASTSPPPLQFRPSASNFALPRRTAAAAMHWSFSLAPRNICPTSNSATSLKPFGSLICGLSCGPLHGTSVNSLIYNLLLVEPLRHQEQHKPLELDQAFAQVRDLLVFAAERAEGRGIDLAPRALVALGSKYLARN
jgi:hypothetical protein